MTIDQLPESYQKQVALQLARSNRIRAIETSVPTTASRTRETLTPDMVDSMIKSVIQSDDGNEIKIVLNISPASLPTAQQKGVFVDKKGHVHFFTKKKVADAEKALTLALEPYSEMTRKWGDEIAIAVSVDFCFPYPTSTPVKKKIQYGYHTSRSDVDNIFKGFGDALTKAGFWKDDALIADLHLKKFRVIDDPRIILTIKNLTPKQECLFDESAMVRR